MASNPIIHNAQKTHHKPPKIILQKPLTDNKLRPKALSPNILK
jgi:hypothetical protein